MVTAKQKAWRKKFAQMAKSGKFQKRGKVKSRSRSNPTMARRRSSRVRTVYARAKRSYRSRGGARGMLGSARGMFTTASKGVGGGLIAETIAERVYPQAAPFAGLGGAYLAGGTTGVVAKVVVDAVTGKGGILSMFTGMGGNGGGDSL